MKRREFTRGLAALAATPLLPVPAVAKIATPAAAIPAANSGYALIFIDAFAKYYVNKVGHCSPQMLCEHFNVSAEMAQSVTNRLIKSGVLSVPNAAGISKSLNPTLSDITPKSDILAKTQDAADHVMELAEAPDQDDQETISDTQDGTISDAGP